MTGDAPEVMTEGNEPKFARYESGYDRADPVDRAIMATRLAVFPEHQDSYIVAH